MQEKGLIFFCCFGEGERRGRGLSGGLASGAPPGRLSQPSSTLMSDTIFGESNFPKHQVANVVTRSTGLMIVELSLCHMDHLVHICSLLVHRYLAVGFDLPLEACNSNCSDCSASQSRLKQALRIPSFRS